MVEPCRPGPRWAETDKPRATHRCGRGTFGARSALKASNWSLTTRTITLTHIKCSTGQMSQCPEVRIHWGAQTFLFVHASQGKYERKPAPLDNCSMCMWCEFSRPLFSTSSSSPCLQNLNAHWLHFSCARDSCKVICLAYLDCNPRQGEEGTSCILWINTQLQEDRWTKPTMIIMIKSKLCKQKLVFKCTSAEWSVHQIHSW